VRCNLAWCLCDGDGEIVEEGMGYFPGEGVGVEEGDVSRHNIVYTTSTVCTVAMKVQYSTVL
jgi:hypothetical protein